MGKKRKPIEDRPMESPKTITLRVNGLTIRPFQPGDRSHPYSQLETQTSIYDPVTYKRIPTNGFALDTNDGTGESMFVTTRQSISYMRNLYPEYDIVEEDIWPSYKIPKGIDMSNEFTPSPIQLDMIERYNDIRNKEAVYLNMPTASGKTLTGIYLALAYKRRVLILCYKSDVLQQWKKSFLKFSNMPEDQIKIITSGPKLDKMYEEMLEPDYEYEGPAIVLCTTVLLRTALERLGPEKFSHMMCRFGFGMKIIDEAHRHVSNTVKINALTNIPRTLYLSAEFRKTNDLTSKYFFSTFFRTNVLVPPKELCDDYKYTIGVVVEYTTMPTQIESDTCFTKRGFSEFSYMRYQMKKGVMLDVIDTLVDGIVNRNDGTKIIVFVDLVEHVDLLFNHFVGRYGRNRNITRLHAGVEDEEREMVSEKADLIVSTYKSLDTGTDITNIKHIISCVPVDVICDNQAAGRSRPLPDGSLCFYYILSDVGFPYIRKRTKMRIESLQERKLVDLYKLKM